MGGLNIILPDGTPARLGGLGIPGKPGRGGGYYTPDVEQVDENTVRMRFTPSAADMPEVDAAEITLPESTGKHGKSAYEYAVEGGFVGTEEDFAELLAGNSVKTFGAVGDGVTDDTAAFQAALAADRVVAVYGGTYVLSDTLVIRENCCLELSQDTVLLFTQTNKNCIEMQRSANIRGNHATIFVPYTFGAHVIHASTDVEDGNARDVPPWSHWNPQWKMTRYITDVNICKPASGGTCTSEDGAVYGTALDIYCERDTKAIYGSNEESFMWGVSISGLRISGGFVYGIHIHNKDTAWNHDMRIEALVEACETAVVVDNCHYVHLAVSIQPYKADNNALYAKNGIKLVNSHYADLSQSFVWDWQHARTDSAEYTHIAMYGDCKGVVMNEPRCVDNPDVRELIYTDTPSNLEKMTILQEPITRWFKTKDGVPYFFDGNGDKQLMTQDAFDECFKTDRVLAFTDRLSTAIDANGNIYNGIGYKKGISVGASNGAEGVDNYYLSTGYIACKAGDVLLTQGLFLNKAFAANDGVAKIVYFDKDFNRIWSATAAVLNPDSPNHSSYFQKATLTKDGFKIEMNPTLSERGTVAYVRLTLRIDEVGEHPLISINEEIKYMQSGFLADGINVKGDAVILTSPNGTQFRLSVADDGTIRGTAVE